MGNAVVGIAGDWIPGADIMQASVNIKEQAHGTHEIFKLVQPPASLEENDGDLVEEARKAFGAKSYDRLREVIRDRLKGYLYNDGEGKFVPVKEIVEWRNNERRMKANKNDSSRAKLLKQSSIYADSFAYSANSGDERFCCWKFDQRGPLGETALHICFLNNSTIHYELAREMINMYPNLLHDIYHGDEYFGENVLHMAIANEDVEMLKFMLKKHEELKRGEGPGINLQERCYGTFFSPRDQKDGRRDSPNSELVKVNSETNYSGLIYWGEYLLSFAACAKQREAVDILLQSGANVLAKDLNGNNVLHMMVIHSNKEMFSYIYDKQEESNKRKLLEERNKQLLTPLTLAAKLANKEMLDFIMELKRQVEWEFGNVTCAKYPLSDVDSINPDDGSINPNSALTIILNKKSRAHLEMLDGLLFQLLHEKWKQYGKVKFFQKFFFFILYVGAFVASVFMQPTPVYTVVDPATNRTELTDRCYLLRASDAQQVVRFVLEIGTEIAALIYLILAGIQIYNEGIRSFAYTLYSAPMFASFHVSLVLTLAIIPCRLSCSFEAENVILTLSICTCVPHLLFFGRGFKVVGPFIVAIYNMIAGDLMRFLVIYAIFLMSFSQAMYIIFRGSDQKLFTDPFQSVMAMFIITLGEFGDLYSDFDNARHPAAAKMLFVVYMIFSTILLINVFIAMMGHTFNKIAETRWEWQRQWARIVLIMEKSVSPDYRRNKQSRYSQPGNELKERWFVVRNFRQNKK